MTLSRRLYKLMKQETEMWDAESGRGNRLARANQPAALNPSSASGSYTPEPAATAPTGNAAASGKNPPHANLNFDWNSVNTMGMNREPKEALKIAQERAMKTGQGKYTPPEEATSAFASGYGARGMGGGPPAEAVSTRPKRGTLTLMEKAYTDLNGMYDTMYKIAKYIDMKKGR